MGYPVRDSGIGEFVGSATHRKSRGGYVPVPPRWAALLERGLVEEAKTAGVVDVPSPEARRSRGFEILYTLDRLDADNGLVDFVAPTEALVAQFQLRVGSVVTSTRSRLGSSS